MPIMPIEIAAILRICSSNIGCARLTLESITTNPTDRIANTERTAKLK